MTHLVDGRPEPHPVDPGRRIGIVRRRLRDERVDEQRGALPVVRADVVEHDPAQARAGLVERRRRRPTSPTAPVGEARPVDLHRVVHLHVRPGRARAELGTELAGIRGHLAAGPPDRPSGSSGVSQGSEAGRTGWAHVLISVSATSPVLEVELEIDRAEVLGTELVDDRPLRRAAAAELDLHACGRPGRGSRVPRSPRRPCTGTTRPRRPCTRSLLATGSAPILVSLAIQWIRATRKPLIVPLTVICG